MTDKDIKYGARSGIQKAIRRGDLNLANTSFDILLSEKAHWQWFKWRLPILVEEEIWYMLGELAELMKSNPTPIDYKRFIYKVCVANKSKDTAGLYRISELENQIIPNNKEVNMMSKYMKVANNNPVSIVEQIYKECTELRQLSEYELDAMKLMRNRTYQGGMLGDRFCCVSSLILITYRGLNKDDITKHIKYAIERYKKKSGNKLPEKIELPWYIFDMHTMKGKMAKGVFERKFLSNYPQITDFTRFWFHNESGYIPDYLIKEIGLIDNPTAFDTMYYPIIKSIQLKGTDGLWKEIQPIIKKLVEWALNKN